MNIQTLKGFRDFLPAEKLKRDWLIERIKSSFKRNAFLPIETPTLEYAELLLGKYGVEADKIVYQFTDNGERQVALRYDQTVPTARVLAQYHDLPKYFRRFQLQNVFRAEKPQRGRYREFLQCDIDIFGSKDALADAEILATVYQVYSSIGFPEFEMRVNDRNLLLNTLGAFATETVDVFSIIQSIDKLDKMSEDDVAIELVEKGLSEESAKQALQKIGSAKITPELLEITNLAKSLGVQESRIVFTPTLARGLDYYTGMIIEVIIPGYPGSVGGGGRYDRLIEKLGSKDIPAVGYAFGFDRIFELADSLGLIPVDSGANRLLVTVFDQSTAAAARVTAELRKCGFVTELFPAAAEPLGKQLKYAANNNYCAAVIVGSDEEAANACQIKNLKNGEQRTFRLDQLSAVADFLGIQVES